MKKEPRDRPTRRQMVCDPLALVMRKMRTKVASKNQASWRLLVALTRASRMGWWGWKPALDEPARVEWGRGDETGSQFCSKEYCGGGAEKRAMNVGTQWDQCRSPKEGLYYIPCVCWFSGKPVMQEEEEVIARRGNCKRSVRRRHWTCKGRLRLRLEKKLLGMSLSLTHMSAYNEKGINAFS